MIRKSISTNFGSSVSAKLAELNLTQLDLSEKINKNSRYVNHTLTGYRKPQPEYVDLVANALNLNDSEREKLHWQAAKDHGFKLDLTKKINA
jgi:cyanate lyase